MPFRSVVTLGIAALLGAAALPRVVNAQQVLGTVLMADSATPAAGVVIEATRLGPNTRVRALTGSGGTFRLVLPAPGRYRLTALRIGYQPSAHGEMELAADETRRVTWVLRSAAVTVATIRVDSTSICGRQAEDGAEVGSLVMQARAALAATLLSSPDGAARAAWKTFRVITDREGTPLTAVTVEPDSGPTDRPFRTVGLDRLEKEGYVHQEAGRLEFRSPDAEVLLSESFMASHCFRRTSATAEENDWVGVSFVPAQRPRSARAALVDVRGVLWLDRQTAELRRLDFGYDGLPAQVERANPGGSVSFRRLPTGVWLVDRWTLRMPRAAMVAMSDNTHQLMVPAIEWKGGVVEAITRGDSVLHGTPFSVDLALPIVAMRADATPACQADYLAEREDRGFVFGTLRDSAGRPVADGRLRATWQLPATATRNRDHVMEREVQVIDGFFIMCGLPTARRFELEAWGAGAMMPAVAMRLRSARPYESLDLALGAKQP